MSDEIKDNGTENEKKIIRDEVIEPIIPLNTKPIPIIVTLCAAAVASILSVIQFVDFGTFFSRLLSAVIIFWILGNVIKLVLDFIFNKKAKALEAESDNDNTEAENIQNIEVEPDGEDGIENESEGDLLAEDGEG